MADPQHLAILKQGVAVWNQWREDNPGTSPDLSGAVLSGSILNRAKLNGAKLDRAKFNGAELIEANLIVANLNGANLNEANLNGAKLNGAILNGAKLNGAKLSRANLFGAKLIEAELIEANLFEAELRGADLSRAILNGAKLYVAKLRGARLGGANLGEANLSRADLSRADLNEANLSRADLSRAGLIETNLILVDLSEANLRRADLRRADLRGANLSEADLSLADLSGALIRQSIFGNVDLSQVKGLESVKHGGPSTIGIDTIYRSEGNIPEEFLRGAGVPDQFIAYIKSLVGTAIEYYSAFISHSYKDEEFTRRLFADLQDNNVRTWYAPEDLKIGDKFRQRIDESIRLHDKLLLVLSSDSVASDWVEFEVEAALAKETERGGDVLFPVRVDDAILQSEKGWAAHIKRTRHIGDFSHWKDHDSYIQAFQRLLRDLKTAGDQKA